MAIIQATDSTFEEKVLKSPSAVLVDFYADWCGPCKLAAPVLEELSEVYAGKVDIVKIDVDKDPKNAEKYGVMSIPTTILFKNDQEIGRQIGFAGRGKFEELIKKGI